MLFVARFASPKSEGVPPFIYTFLRSAVLIVRTWAVKQLSFAHVRSPTGVVYCHLSSCSVCVVLFLAGILPSLSYKERLRRTWTVHMPTQPSVWYNVLDHKSGRQNQPLHKKLVLHYTYVML